MGGFRSYFIILVISCVTNRPVLGYQRSPRLFSTLPFKTCCRLHVLKVVWIAAHGHRIFSFKYSVNTKYSDGIKAYCNPFTSDPSHQPWMTNWGPQLSAAPHQKNRTQRNRARFCAVMCQRDTERVCFCTTTMGKWAELLPKWSKTTTCFWWGSQLSMVHNQI